jgi:hypothetical protein
LGYYSDAVGEITLYKKTQTDMELFEKFCEKEEIEFNSFFGKPETSYEIEMLSWRMYAGTSSDIKRILTELSKFGKFSLEVTGTDPGDVWKIRGNHGKVEKLMTTVVWDKEWTVI